MKAKDVMTKNPETATSGTFVGDVARMMRDLDVGIVPVVDGEKLLGVITDRDITIRVTAAGLNPYDTSIQPFVSPNPVTVSPDEDIEKVRQIMSDQQIRRVLVAEGDKLVGVISIGDVAVRGKSDDKEVGEALQDISEPTDLRRN